MQQNLSGNKFTARVEFYYNKDRLRPDGKPNMMYVDIAVKNKRDLSRKIMEIREKQTGEVTVTKWYIIGGYSGRPTT